MDYHALNIFEIKVKQVFYRLCRNKIFSQQNKIKFMKRTAFIKSISKLQEEGKKQHFSAPAISLEVIYGNFVYCKNIFKNEDIIKPFV